MLLMGIREMAMHANESNNSEGFTSLLFHNVFSDDVCRQSAQTVDLPTRIMKGANVLGDMAYGVFDSRHNLFFYAMVSAYSR